MAHHLSKPCGHKTKAEELKCLRCQKRVADKRYKQRAIDKDGPLIAINKLYFSGRIFNKGK